MNETEGQNKHCAEKWFVAEATPEKLIRDVRVVIRDADDLIKATTGDVREPTREARAKLAGALGVVKETCRALERRLHQTKPPKDAFLRENLYGGIGFAFGVGLLVGLCLSESRGDKDRCRD